MKFHLSLKYNSVPEWQDHYVHYDQLKRMTYEFQREGLVASSGTDSAVKVGSSADSEAGEITTEKKSKKKSYFGVPWKGKSSINENTFEMEDLESQSSASKNPKSMFLSKLYDELAMIETFYKKQEDRQYAEYEKLINQSQLNKILLSDNSHMLDETRSILSRKSSIAQEIIHANNAFGGPHIDVNKPGSASHYENATIEEDDDEDEDNHSQNSALLSDADVKDVEDTHLTLTVQNVFFQLSQLKSYIELNRQAFFKITKKFDKTIGTDIRPTMLDNGVFFQDSYAFSPETITELDAKLDSLTSIYARLEHLSLTESRTKLRSQLKEHIVWGRATVWKEMIAIENKNAALEGVTDGSGAESGLYDLEYYSWKLPKPINLYFTKIENFKVPKLVNTSRTYKLIVIIAITAVLLGVKTFNDEAEHRCMALLACVALLWATEAIPLFVTSLLCPLLVVLFRVVKDTDTGSVMTASSASSYVLSQMWSSTIMVLLGGFALAAALSKYNIAKVAASYILAFAGNKPRNMLLSIMAVALFLSMWISNVATPVLCYSLLTTVLRQLEHDEPFAQALVLGVALACNIAGMSSPISSPQNVVAMEYLASYGIGWGQWLGVSIPVSIISLVLVWALLILTFKINKSHVTPMKPIKDSFTLKQWFIIFVLVGTILLWCVLTKIQSSFGDAGEIAVLPLVLLFGTGLLSTSDINNFPWSIVVLAMGSLALGKAVSSSGLLATIAGALQKKVMDFDVWVIMIIFGLLILVIGTFVSHTVSAIIIIPLVQEIGDSLSKDNAAAILIFGTALLASCGMGLASSGFPNVTAISMTDDLGRRYLTVNTFITRGVPSSFLAYIVVITVGYGIMLKVITGS